MQLITRSFEQTQSLGKVIGAALKKGVVFALSGDLGCGKTVFVQGLAIGIGVSEDEYITSPTFTLINEYHGRLKLTHVDLYRLDTVSDIDDIGLEEALESGGVVAIEWADKLSANDMQPDVHIHIEMMDHQMRRITIWPEENDFSTVITKWSKELICD